MTVGDTRTYTVGYEQVWVHNACDLLGKKIKNNNANDFAKSKGYADAHKLKEAYVGKSDVAKFDIYLDKKTGLSQLVSKDGKIIIDIVD